MLAGMDTRHACVSLPIELWQKIASTLKVKEWVKTCGTVCRAFNQLQPKFLHIYIRLDKRGDAALRWAGNHWGEAQKINLGFISTVSVPENQICTIKTKMSLEGFRCVSPNCYCRSTED